MSRIIIGVPNDSINEVINKVINFVVHELIIVAINEFLFNEDNIPGVYY